MKVAIYARVSVSDCPRDQNDHAEHVAIYARVSVSDSNKDKQRDSESIDTQETRCRQHAASAGLEIYRVYKDDGRSLRLPTSANP